MFSVKSLRQPWSHPFPSLLPCKGSFIPTWTRTAALELCEAGDSWPPTGMEGSQREKKPDVRKPARQQECLWPVLHAPRRICEGKSWGDEKGCGCSSYRIVTPLHLYLPEWPMRSHRRCNDTFSNKAINVKDWNKGVLIESLFEPLFKGSFESVKASQVFYIINTTPIMIFNHNKSTVIFNNNKSTVLLRCTVVYRLTKSSSCNTTTCYWAQADQLSTIQTANSYRYSAKQERNTHTVQERYNTLVHNNKHLGDILENMHTFYRLAHWGRQFLGPNPMDLSLAQKPVQ